MRWRHFTYERCMTHFVTSYVSYVFTVVLWQLIAGEAVEWHACLFQALPFSFMMTLLYFLVPRSGTRRHRKKS